MTNYFRIHLGKYSLSQLQNHVSGDGGDDMFNKGGICATESISDLLNNTAYDLVDEAEAEVVVLRGQHICDIYDGVRIYPTEIVARFAAQEFAALERSGEVYAYEDF